MFVLCKSDVFECLQSMSNNSLLLVSISHFSTYINFDIRENVIC